MKRIEFIQPVESMRGSFGAKQDLRYQEHNNKAFEAPEDKVNYAKNYQPTFVGAKVARTGVKYFSVKTKSATKNTAAWRLVAALMGAVSAIYGWCITQLDKMAQLSAQYALAVEQGFEGTLRKFIIDGVRTSLAAKAATITVVGPTATVILGNNPFSSAAEAIPIQAKILAKFWKQLTPDGITFSVAGNIGVAVNGYSFAAVANNTRLNVLGLNTDGDYTMIGSQYLIYANGDYCNTADLIDENAVFTLSDVAPEP